MSQSKQAYDVAFALQKDLEHDGLVFGHVCRPGSAEEKFRGYEKEFCSMCMSCHNSYNVHRFREEKE